MGGYGSADLWTHWDAMVRAARRVLGCRDRAEETAADVIAELVASPPNGDIRNLEAFLVTVARRRAIDRFRADLSARRRLERYAAGQQGHVVDASDAIAERDEAAWVDAQARLLLPERGYDVLRLVADGVPLEEVAHTLSITRRAAEGHLRRARITLRSALAKTIAALGLLLGSVKRSTATAGPATAVAASVVLLLVLPMRVPDGPEGLRIEAPRADLVLTESPKRRVAAPRPAGHDRAEARPSKPGGSNLSPRPEPMIQSPVVGFGTYTMDDGYEAEGPADLVLHCVENLHVDLTSAGCDDTSPENRAAPT